MKQSKRDAMHSIVCVRLDNLGAFFPLFKGTRARCLKYCLDHDWNEVIDISQVGDTFEYVRRPLSIVPQYTWNGKEKLTAYESDLYSKGDYQRSASYNRGKENTCSRFLRL